MKEKIEDLLEKMLGRVDRLEPMLERMEEIVFQPPENSVERDSVNFLQMQEEFERLMKMYLQMIDTARKGFTAIRESERKGAGTPAAGEMSETIEEIYEMLKVLDKSEIHQLRDLLIKMSQERSYGTDQDAG